MTCNYTASILYNAFIYVSNNTNIPEKRAHTLITCATTFEFRISRPKMMVSKLPAN